MSFLTAIFDLKFDHPSLYRNLSKDGKDIVFIWVSGHVGIRGNSVADSAVKDAFDGDVSVELIPFSDLKSRANKYIKQLWQSEWHEFRTINYIKYFQF